MNISLRPILSGISLAALLLFCCPGCESKKPLGQSTSVDSAEPKTEAVFVEEPPIGEPTAFEVDAKGLLAATLDDAALKDGWINLDGRLSGKQTGGLRRGQSKSTEAKRVFCVQT
jgi:hypothetical protein